MPLPATRHTLPNVDSPRDQRPGVDPCAHAQVDCLLWRGELGDGEVCIQLVRNVRRQDIRGVLDVAAAPTYPGKTHGHCLGQRQIPPCQTARAAVAKYRKVLTLLFLPPYSPQLAPIERVWKLTRRLATHNRYFETLGEVLEVVQQCFARWTKPNLVLRRLCGII